MAGKAREAMRLGSFFSATVHVGAVAGILWFGLGPKPETEAAIAVLVVAASEAPGGGSPATGDAEPAAAPSSAPNAAPAPPTQSEPAPAQEVVARSMTGPREAPPDPNPPPSAETIAVEPEVAPAPPPQPTPKSKPEAPPMLAAAAPTVEPPPEPAPAAAPEPTIEPSSEPAATAATDAAAGPASGAPATDGVELASTGDAATADPGTGIDEGSGGSGAGDPAVSADYAAVLAAWLERYKRYPDAARRKRQEGTVLCEFAIDASGRVVSRRIVEGSGYAMLDAAVDELFERANPVPPPPAGAALSYVVPIVFALR